MANISINEIIKRKVCKIDDLFIWSILSISLESIQSSDMTRTSEFILITPNNTFITSVGKIIFTLIKDYEKIYFSPDKIRYNFEWGALNNFEKEQMIIFSLGKTLKFCINEGASQINRELNSLINKMTNPNSQNAINLLSLQQICNISTKMYLYKMSFKTYLSQIHRTYSTMPKIIRSLSTSSLSAKTLAKTCAEMKDTSQDNEIKNNSNNTNGNSGPISTPKNGNIYLSRMDNYSKINIPASIERVKVLRKHSKNCGPVRSPRIIHNGHEDSVDHGRTDSYKKSFTCSENPLNNEATDDNINNDKEHIAGPEFIIRQSETYSVTYNLQRKNSIFTRSNSGRHFNYVVEVHLLDGVRFLVGNLNKHSILSHVINSIHETFPDLEFVNYGLCFTLNNEYFFLKEEINIQKLADYVLQKMNGSKQRDEIENKKVLHLYYRIKFYPTIEIIEEMNYFNRKLFYLQLRQDLLYMNKPPICIKEAFEYAGIAVQAEFGIKDNVLLQNQDYLKIRYYYNKLFQDFLDASIDETTFLRYNQENWKDEFWERCESLFIEKIYQNKFYGFHWYRVNKNQFNVIDPLLQNTYLLIGRDSIQLLEFSQTCEELQVHKYFSYKWRQIQSISIKHKKLVIKPKMRLKVEGLNAPNAFICYVDSRTKAEHIVRLFNDHHLLASQNEDLDRSIDLSQSLGGSHRRLSVIDYPSFKRNSFAVYDHDDDDDDDDDDDNDNDDDDFFVKDHVDDQRSYQKPSHYDAYDYCPKPEKQYFGSLNNLSARKVKRNKSLSHISLEESTYMVNNCEQPRRIYQKNSMEPQLKNVKNQKLMKDLVEVNLTRQMSVNESLGLGIIKIKSPSREGIFIKRIMKGSQTEKCGQLDVGDEIVFINDEMVSHLTQTEVGEIIKSCGKSVKLSVTKSQTNWDENNKNVSKIPKVKENVFPKDDDLSTIKISSVNVRGKKLNFYKKLTLQEILNSENAFSFLQEYVFHKYIPILKLTNCQSHFKVSGSNFDEFIWKEIKKLKAKLLINSNTHLKNSEIDDKLDERRTSNGYISDLSALQRSNCQIVRIESEKLLATKTSSPVNDISFILFQLRKKWDSSMSKAIVQKKCRLIISFDPQLNGFLTSHNTSFTNNKDFKDKNNYLLSVDETHQFSRAITFYRLTINTSDTELVPKNQHPLFVVSFSNLNEELKNYKSHESVLQAINIACSIKENCNDPGPITIFCNQLDSGIWTFISFYSLIKLGAHENLPINPVTKYQTIIYELFSQLSAQMDKMVPNEDQYRICIAMLKQMMPVIDNTGSQSDISDFNN